MLHGAIVDVTRVSHLSQLRRHAAGMRDLFVFVLSVTEFFLSEFILLRINVHQSAHQENFTSCAF